MDLKCEYLGTLIFALEEKLFPLECTRLHYLLPLSFLPPPIRHKIQEGFGIMPCKKVSSPPPNKPSLRCSQWKNSARWTWTLSPHMQGFEVCHANLRARFCLSHYGSLIHDLLPCSRQPAVSFPQSFQLLGLLEQVSKSE